MLELGGSQTPDQTPAAAGELIKDGTEATFMADVIEGSRETPVIVDFWATWCGPCKTLTPMLEAAVTAAKGKVRMIKIDVDKEQRLAGALAQQGLPLQSIPTVVAFFGGQPVDMFQGAIPQGQINEFVTKLAAMAGDGGLGEAIEAAEEMLAEGAVADAAQTFAAILGEEPENAAAMAGLARRISRWAARSGRGAVEQRTRGHRKRARDRSRARPDRTGAPGRGCRSPGRAFRRGGGRSRQPPGAVRLCLALHAAGQVEEAVEQLLELFRRDREWNDAAAKTQLFTIFDALKPTDPIAQKGRRRLSSMIFA
jgi:putative thioredoxin